MYGYDMAKPLRSILKTSSLPTPNICGVVQFGHSHRLCLLDLQGVLCDKHGKLRPYAIDLVDELLMLDWSIGIYSEMSIDAINSFLTTLLPSNVTVKMPFIFSQDDCFYSKKGRVIKPLTQVWTSHQGWNRDNTLLIDDDKHVWLNDPLNTLCVPTWDGTNTDVVLKSIMSKLPLLSKTSVCTVIPFIQEQLWTSKNV
jgi:NLI interacting factor-like phosphatase